MPVMDAFSGRVLSFACCRAGTESTPWQDRFDLDGGHISYSGDNKVDKGPPEQAPGNKDQLESLG